MVYIRHICLHKITYKAYKIRCPNKHICVTKPLHFQFCHTIVTIM